MHIKKGDKVIVIAGKEKGKTASVLSASPKKNQVILEGLNIYKKHKKARSKTDKGGIIDVRRPIHVSNVKLVEKKEKKVGKSKK